MLLAYETQNLRLWYKQETLEANKWMSEWVSEFIHGTKAQFPLPELTARGRVMETGHPSTRAVSLVVETGLKC